MPPKAKAAEKSALAEIEREKKAAEDKEKQDAAEWSVGAKDNARARAQEEKEADRLRKAAELEAIKAQDEADTSGIKQVKKTKKKGKDDFDMLNAALAAAPKTKAQKDAELKKKEKEEQMKAQQAVREAKEAQRKAGDDEIRKLAAKGIIVNHADELMIPINNRLDDDEDNEGFADISGVDNALGALSLGRDIGSPQKMKALYNAFYAANLPVVKEMNPGLKLSQYKERVFDMWQSSPENPKNQKQR